MMVEHLKHEGISHSSSDLLKIFVKMGVSWSAQVLRQAGDTLSGSGAFLIFFSLKTWRTSSSVIFSAAVGYRGVQDQLRVIKMAPRMAAVLHAPGKLCSFSYVLFVFLLFYVLDVVSITVYDRDTLLNIGSSVAQRKPDFEFLNAGGLFTDIASEPFVWVAKSRRRFSTPKTRKKSWRSRQTETPCFPTSSSNHFTGQRSVTG